MLVRIDSSLQAAREAADLRPGSVSPIDEASFRRTGPHRHLAVLNDGHELEATASIWIGRDADGEETDSGIVGHFAAGDADSGAIVLEAACSDLRALGSRRVIGPMDGSTWHTYRFIAECGEEPPFFLEMNHPAAWPEMWKAAGFGTLAQYTSALNPDLGAIDPKTAGRLANLTANGVTLRPLDPGHFELELEGLYELSLAAFSKNYLYSPIDRQSFLDLYLPIAEFVVPELVQIAELRGERVGYVFAIPDLLEAKRDGRAQTIIVKTVAVHPSVAGGGLGSVLVDLCQREGAQLGFSRAIHAFMHETNRSRAISAKFGQTIRRYNLYVRDLE